MDKDLINSLFSDKIAQAKELVGLRKSALGSAKHNYKQAKEVLYSMEGNVESAESSLRYLEKQKEEMIELNKEATNDKTDKD